jgi:signal transduction histidine kinase
MDQNSKVAVGNISHRLREWIHEVNNALFITKGFLEEIEADAKSRSYLKSHFDHDNFLEMIQTVSRSVERIDRNVQKLRKYAREDVFNESGVERPSRRSENLVD